MQLAAVLFVIILVILMIFVLSSDVNLSIKIDKKEVNQGGDITLDYEIENGYWFNEAKYVKLEWEILNKNGFQRQNETINYYTLQPHEKKTNSVVIETSKLVSGQYTLWVHLDYWVMGKWETKHLSLEFIIN